VKIRRWEAPDEPLPARPYRNTAIFHAVLAGLIVLVAWLTAGDIGTAIVVAVGFFVVATSWSFWRWRQRLEEERLKQARRDRGSAARRSAR
jgi:membrane protein implicated in regulation of membrane protease activity